MDPAEIPRHKVESTHSPLAQKIRAHTPELLISLISEGSLENIESIADITPGSVTALEGGVASACYFMENNGQPIVVKFRIWGINAEAESLKAWKAAGASVPEVKSHGIVPLEIGSSGPVKYLIMEGIVDEKGKIASTAEKLVSNSENKLTELAEQMGQQLYLMHQVVTEQPFGDLADLSHGGREKSWNAYLASMIEKNKGYLLGIGIPLVTVEATLEKISQINFPKKGSYLHNDYAIHNILVEDEDPLKIKVFDPDPLIGDPYFDLAGVIMRGDYQKTLEKVDNPDNPNPPWLEKNLKIISILVETYEQQLGNKLDQQRLLVNLIGAAIPKALYQEGRGNLKEIGLRRGLVKDYINRLVTYEI